MGYKYEGKLRQRAEKLISRLADRKLSGIVTMVRDYMIRIEIRSQESESGTVTIYYKPTADKYSLKTGDLDDKQVISDLEELWRAFTGDDYQGYRFFVDGSYIGDQVGYGCVVVKDNEIVDEFSGQAVKAPYTDHHQIGGEIKAVEEAVNWAKNEGLTEMKIYYDLVNLEKWAKGEFKTNNRLTRDYKEFLDECKIKIKWQKVSSHSGDKWNEYADKLARQGARADR